MNGKKYKPPNPPGQKVHKKQENKSMLSAGFQWTVHNTHWYHAALFIKSA
jgi:hypothetical protein